MTIRRVRKDARSAARARLDAEAAALAERGKFAPAEVRREALASARERGQARMAARRRLERMGEIELPVTVERHGREFLAYIPILPTIRVSASTRSQARARVLEALQALVAADPVAVAAALAVEERTQDSVRFRVGS